MRITTLRITQWAQSREAQAELPRLVRRLVRNTSTTAAVAMPSGESVGLPGWDGIVQSNSDSAWAPRGTSFWETSCEERDGSKATTDYNKRTAATSVDQRDHAAFVFVTARRWPRKTQWLERKRAQKEWADVRAFDADDLEHWLEQCPAVALAFAEELGIAGPGVETPRRSWEAWASHSTPTLTVDALFEARETLRNKLIAEVRNAITNSRPPITLRGDSVAEAAAFACAAILSEPSFRDAVVVTHSDGWRYVEKNAELTIAITATPEIATRAPRRAGLAIVVPHALGDIAQSSASDSEPEFRLERPDRHAFEAALIKLGVEQHAVLRTLRDDGYQPL